MADSTPNRPPNRSDEDIVAAAFASYKAAAPEHFHPISATALMTRAEAAARPKRRGLTVSLASMACGICVIAGVAIAQAVVPTGSDPVGADGSTTQRDKNNPDGDKGSQSTVSASPSIGTTSEEFAEQIDTSTIALPSWPGDLADLCPAGDYMFTPREDGGAVPLKRDSAETGTENGWKLLPDGADAVNAQLESGSEDVIVPVACGDTAGVVALSRHGDSFDDVGFVYADNDKSKSKATVEEVDGTTVTVSVVDDADKKPTMRMFTYSDGKFDETDSKEKPSDSPSPSTQPQDSPSDDDSGDDDGGGDDDDDSSSEEPDEPDKPSSSKPDSSEPS